MALNPSDQSQRDDSPDVPTIGDQSSRRGSDTRSFYELQFGENFFSEIPEPARENINRRLDEVFDITARNAQDLVDRSGRILVGFNAGGLAAVLASISSLHSQPEKVSLFLLPAAVFLGGLISVGAGILLRTLQWSLIRNRLGIDFAQFRRGAIKFKSTFEIFQSNQIRTLRGLIGAAALIAWVLFLLGAALTLYVLASR